MKAFAYNVFVSVSMTLILLVVLEIGMFFATEIYYARLNAPKNYGADNDYLNEVAAVRRGFHHSYCSFIDHCSQPFANVNFTIVAEGERGTRNACHLGGTPIIIWVFGGSTTFCAEVYDEDTWPSYLSALLCNDGYNVFVRNFGDSGYTSTQEVAKLLLKLRNTPAPDYVVFYDGINDYYSAYQSGRPGEPQNLFNRYLAFDVFVNRNILNPILVSSTMRALRFVQQERPVSYTDSHATALGAAIQQVYVNNTKLVYALADKYDFTPLFFWQPAVFTKDTLSDYESSFNSSTGSVGFSVRAGYKNITFLEENVHSFHDIQDVFDAENESLFIDTAHVGRKGNKLVASVIADHLEASFARDDRVPAPSR